MTEPGAQPRPLALAVGGFSRPRARLRAHSQSQGAAAATRIPQCQFTRKHKRWVRLAAPIILFAVPPPRGGRRILAPAPHGGMATQKAAVRGRTLGRTTLGAQIHGAVNAVTFWVQALSGKTDSSRRQLALRLRCASCLLLRTRSNFPDRGWGAISEVGVCLHHPPPRWLPNPEQVAQWWRIISATCAPPHRPGEGNKTDVRAKVKALALSAPTFARDRKQARAAMALGAVTHRAPLPHERFSARWRRALSVGAA